jgi:hypothetical protein
MNKYLVIQDKENGKLYAALKCWTENGVKRFARVTEFTDNKNDALAFIASVV